MAEEKIYIIILNYNSWKDTIECVESILRLAYTNFRIVLVDNNSTDDSVERLIAWMDGTEQPPQPTNPSLEKYSLPPVEKPIPFIFPTDDTNNAIVFIKSDINKGYAGGNNLGIHYGMEQGDADYFWVLNNDTVVPPGSLKEIMAYIGKLKGEGKVPGIIGSKLRFYDNPDTLQGVGAVFNKYTARIKQIGTFEKDKGQYDDNLAQVDFVIGASLFASVKMIEEIGPMAEEYFLYNEEIDWCLRAKRAGYFVGYSAKGLIYHKQGASTKNSVKSKKKNLGAMFYQFRNILLFYKKFYPFLSLIPICMVSLRIIKFGLFSDKKFFSLLYPVLSLQKEYGLSKNPKNAMKKKHNKKATGAILDTEKSNRL